MRVEMGLLDVRWISSKINLDEGTSLPLFSSLGNHFDFVKSRSIVKDRGKLFPENFGNGKWFWRPRNSTDRRRRNTVFHAINSNYNQSTSMWNPTRSNAFYSNRFLNYSIVLFIFFFYFSFLMWESKTREHVGHVYIYIFFSRYRDSFFLKKILKRAQILLAAYERSSSV